MDEKFVEDLFKKVSSKYTTVKPPIVKKEKPSPQRLPTKQASVLAKQFLQEYLKKEKEEVPVVKVEQPTPKKEVKAKPVRLTLNKKVKETKDGKDGRTPELAIRENSLMWKYVDEDDDSWQKLFDLDDLQQPTSASKSLGDIMAGGGGGGKRVVTEFKEEEGIVYYKASDEDDDCWIPLFELPSGEIGPPQYKVEDHDVYWRASDEEEWVYMYTVPVPENVGFIFDGGFPNTDYVTVSPAFSCGGVV